MQTEDDGRSDTLREDEYLEELLMMTSYTRSTLSETPPDGQTEETEQTDRHADRQTCRNRTDRQTGTEQNPLTRFVEETPQQYYSSAATVRVLSSKRRSDRIVSKKTLETLINLALHNYRLNNSEFC